MSKMTQSGTTVEGDNHDQARGLMDSKYARSKGELMALINDIRSTGASLDVDLPTIVVAGNQSSGKSSLIEAISGINLPRAAGTCTRVPIEVRLRSDPDAAWRCIVKIRKESKDVVSGEEPEETSAAGSAPESTFGSPLTNPNDVELAIRRAQLAILNPSVDAHEFLTYDIPEEEVKTPLGSVGQLSFSKNVVVVEISGANVTDLTLIDLPGIIHSVGKKEDKANIKLVEDLVKHYIAKDCLILCVITMKDDIDNQNAAMLARDVDPKGERTIGVLTKVDTLEDVEREHWVKVLRNEKQPLLHGYYVTRQPTPSELHHGITFETARAKEAKFFSNTKPWDSLHPTWKARLGTTNLANSLSEHLMSYIREKLPSTIKQIKRVHADVTAELKGMPAPPPAQPLHQMLALVDKFCQGIGSYAAGSANHRSLIQQFNSTVEGYHSEVWCTAPLFEPFCATEKKVPVQQAAVKPTVDDRESDSDDDEERDPDDEEETDSEDDKQTEPDHGATTVNEPPLDLVDDFEACHSRKGSTVRSEVMNLDDIREHIKRSVARELPGEVPSEAKEALIKNSTSSWGGISQDFLQDMVLVLKRVLGGLIEEIFGAHKTGMLSGTVKSIVSQQVALRVKAASSLIDKLIELEARPFTQNLHYLQTTQQKVLAQLVARRAKGGGWSQKTETSANATKSTGSRMKPAENSSRDLGVKTVLAQLSKLGHLDLTEGDLARLRPSDPYHTELQLMADVRAYWQVAFKRIIDNIPRVIDAELFVPLAENVRNALLTDLDILSEGGEERCRAYFSENLETSRLREELQEKEARLSQAKKALRKWSGDGRPKRFEKRYGTCPKHGRRIVELIKLQD